MSLHYFCRHAFIYLRHFTGKNLQVSFVYGNSPSSANKSAETDGLLL